MANLRGALIHDPWDAERCQPVVLRNRLHYAPPRAGEHPVVLSVELEQRLDGGVQVVKCWDDDAVPVLIKVRDVLIDVLADWLGSNLQAVEITLHRRGVNALPRR